MTGTATQGQGPPHDDKKTRKRRPRCDTSHRDSNTRRQHDGKDHLRTTNTTRNDIAIAITTTTAATTCRQQHVDDNKTMRCLCASSVFLLFFFSFFLPLFPFFVLVQQHNTPPSTHPPSSNLANGTLETMFMHVTFHDGFLRVHAWDLP